MENISKVYTETESMHSFSSTFLLKKKRYNLEDDYLIVGENIVRGEKESIKNLVEIFDGLLEYLNEEINEESPSCGKELHLLLSCK